MLTCCVSLEIAGALLLATPADDSAIILHMQESCLPVTGQSLKVAHMEQEH